MSRDIGDKLYVTAPPEPLAEAHPGGLFLWYYFDEC